VASYNRIIIVGNLTRDPELRQLQGGQAVCKLNVATNRQFKNKAGAVVQEVCYVDVDVWGAQAESCNQYLRKGRAILVDGRLKLDSWKEADGQTRSKHSIMADSVVFLTPAQGAQTGSESFAPTEMSESSALNARRAPAVNGRSDVPPAAGGSPLFKDEEPFPDDLPF
jgi:single-strand DNA-binding protein